MSSMHVIHIHASRENNIIDHKYIKLHFVVLN